MAFERWTPPKGDWKKFQFEWLIWRALLSRILGKSNLVHVVELFNFHQLHHRHTHVVRVQSIPMNTANHIIIVYRTWEMGHLTCLKNLVENQSNSSGSVEMENSCDLQCDHHVNGNLFYQCLLPN